MIHCGSPQRFRCNPVTITAIQSSYECQSKSTQFRSSPDHSISTCVLNIISTKRFVTTSNRAFSRCRLNQRSLHSTARLLWYTQVAPSDRSSLEKGHEEKRMSLMEIHELVDYLRNENASDICVIRVPPSMDYVDYFVVCSGFGARHLRRMADGLVAEVGSFSVHVWKCSIRLHQI